MKNIELDTKKYLYRRFNDFKTNKDYEAAAAFLFNVQKGTTTISMKKEIFEYICENFDDLYIAMLKCKY